MTAADKPMEGKFMLRNYLITFVPAFLLGMSNLAAAQVSSVYECEVESEAAFIDGLNRFYETMAGGFRPVILLDDIVWNGSDESTHRLIFAYADYEEYEVFQGRLADTPEATLVIESTSEIAECNNERLSLERGFWGRQGSDLTFIGLVPIFTSAPAQYAEAFADLANSEIGSSAPGGVGIFESRAGGDGVSFFVTYSAPSMSALNEWVDALTQSDDFADFVEEVGEIRSLGSTAQLRRIRTWQP